MRVNHPSRVSVSQKKEAVGAVLLLASLLFVGAGCSGANALSANPSSRCQAQADQQKQQDMLAEPGIVGAYNESNYYNNTLGACLYSVEYAGTMKKYPKSVWVVDSLVIDTANGKTLAEYLTQDGKQTSTMDLTAFLAAQKKLFGE
jgi:hypothetical protein